MTDIPTAQTSAIEILPSYVYQEYSDDDALQAFASTYNGMAQGYLDWFNDTPLALYTSPSISGPLLDWVGKYFYGIPRPVLGNFHSYNIGAVNTYTVNSIAVNGSQQITSGSASPVNDDIYKRVLTWWFYRGDGKNMSIDWIKRRVTRFMHGVNGGDVAYPASIPPGISFGASVFIGATNSYPVNALALNGSSIVGTPGFTITVPTGTIGQTLQTLIQNGVLALPFEIAFTVSLI